MKSRKYILVISMIIILLLPSMIRADKKGLFADLSIKIFSNSDAEFKEVYQSSIMVPEINIGYFLSENLYIFGGFEFYKVDGKTPEWQFTLEMDQKIFSFGAGYFKKISEKLGLSGAIGLVSISYTEKLLDLELENKSSSIGFRLRTKFQYKISALIGLYFKLGYTMAKDTLDDLENNFGGFSTGLGLKLSF